MDRKIYQKLLVWKEKIAKCHICQQEQGRQEKLLKTLEKNSNEHTVMTQEDLAVFIDRIVVKKDKIEIETIDDQKCELLLNQISQKFFQMNANDY